MLPFGPDLRGTFKQIVQVGEAGEFCKEGKKFV